MVRVRGKNTATNSSVLTSALNYSSTTYFTCSFQFTLRQNTKNIAVFDCSVLYYLWNCKHWSNPEWKDKSTSWKYIQLSCKTRVQTTL